MITTRQFNVLKILDEKNCKLTPTEIYNIYQNNFGKISNVHVQLYNLLGVGYVKRVGKQYEITERGKKFIRVGEQEPSESVNFSFSESQIERIKSFPKDPNFLENLTSMFCPHLIGLEDIKLASILTLISADDVGFTKNRLNLLIIGEPGTGKSEILRYMSSQLWGVFCDRNTSQGGFRGVANGYQYKPGVLQLANGKILYIDELDKFKPSELDILLSALSYGKISIKMDKVDKETETKIRCIAVCNNEKRLKQELIDRFDLVLTVKPLTDEFRKHIINSKINTWNNTFIDQPIEDFIKHYLFYAFLFKSKFPEDREEITNLLNSEEVLDLIKTKSPRKIESILRLSLAISKLYLEKEVTVDHVKLAIKLVSKSKY